MTQLFEDLLVLELSNNHRGDVQRGLKIIEEFSRVVCNYPIKAAIKLQFRNADKFVHQDFREYKELRYVSRVLDNVLSHEEYDTLVKAIKQNAMIAMSTPFDEESVDLCLKLGIDIIKIASVDLNDTMLTKKIISAQKPVIVSTGGAKLEDIDHLVKRFEEANIPLAINHCVSVYPCKKSDLQLNQIDFLKNRYPGHVIGFSTHENEGSPETAMMLAYAKGARTFERHIDLSGDGRVLPYCSTPETIETWIKAFLEAKEICGDDGNVFRTIPQEERKYLDTMVRGIYLKRNIKSGEIIHKDDIYASIPLQKGQISVNEFCGTETAARDFLANAPLTADGIQADYLNCTQTIETIRKRGL